MKKLLLIIALKLRRVWSPVFEYFATRRLVKDDRAYKKFVSSIHNIYQYHKAIEKYAYKSDKLKGLIDWSPSEKNLWTFFVDKEHSRDCDDFSALAYHTLKKFEPDVIEYCCLIGDKWNAAHMFTVVGNIAVCCNNRVLFIDLDYYLRQVKSTICVRVR